MSSVEHQSASHMVDYSFQRLHGEHHAEDPAQTPHYHSMCGKPLINPVLTKHLGSSNNELQYLTNRVIPKLAGYGIDTPISLWRTAEITQCQHYHEWRATRRKVRLQVLWSKRVQNMVHAQQEFASESLTRHQQWPRDTQEGVNA